MNGDDRLEQRRKRQELEDEINNKRILELQLQYDVWIGQPMTNQLIANLRKLKDSFASSSLNDASAINVPDAHFRHLAISMKNTEAILTMVTSFKSFAKQSGLNIDKLT